MATIDIAPNSGSRKGFARYYKKLSYRIDMTPMVDLGFLLITFFIFTATMSEPTTMNLYMPADKGAPTNVGNSGALTIIIDKPGKMYFYEGMVTKVQGKLTPVSAINLRSEIIQKKNEIAMKSPVGGALEALARENKTTPENYRQKDFFILIKPTSEASYDDVVTVLDEMTINKVAHYALTEPKEEELALIK